MRFVETVTYYERQEYWGHHGWAVRIVTATGNDFTFYSHPEDSLHLELDLLEDIVGPDDAIPEEYEDIALDLSGSGIMIAVWLADGPNDLPHNFKLLCSRDTRNKFNDAIYPADEDMDGWIHH